MSSSHALLFVLLSAQVSFAQELHVDVDPLPVALQSSENESQIAALTEFTRECVGASQSRWVFDIVILSTGHLGWLLNDPDTEETRCLQRALRSFRLNRSPGDAETIRLRVRPSALRIPAPYATRGAVQPRLFRGRLPHTRPNDRPISHRVERDVVRVVRTPRPIVGPLDGKTISRVLHQHWQAIRRCYEVEPREVDIEFQVNAGRVTVARVIAPTGALAACVVDEIRTWQFPATAEPIRVRHAYVFATNATPHR